MVGSDKLGTLGLWFVLALAISPALHATTITIDFESFNDSDIVTNQLPDLTFADTIILSSGISLNEFEFPPHSGSNVASDNGGPITIDFANPTDMVAGYFTYTEPFTLTAFDSTDTEVASASSAFSNNEAISGDPGSSPNEYIGVSWAAGISSVTLEADPNGGSFTLDDLTYDGVQTASTPEPSSLMLFMGAAGVALAASRLRHPTCRLR